MVGAFGRQTLASALVGALIVAWPSSTDAQQQERQTTIEDHGAAAEYKAEPQGLFFEPDVIGRAAIYGDRHFGNGRLNNGLYADVWNMIPGAGWISLGPGYRHWYAKDSVFVDTAAAISWRGYKTAQARAELPKLLSSRLSLGSHLQWQDYTQVSFYGTGSASRESNVSEYRLRSTNLVGYATFRPLESIGIDGHLGWLKPSVLPRAGLFKRDRPDTQDAFPRDIVFAMDDQPDFLHSGIALTVDTRDFPGHPTRGGLVRAAAAHYSDRDAHLFSFRRYEAEAAGFLPFADSRVVVAVHGWLVGSDTGDNESVPFYLQPSLGGQNSLRGYAEYRFQDRSLMLVNVEARVVMMTHVDAAFFMDAGNVASRIGDLDLEKRSYGAGLRLHSRRQTYARVDLARSEEGWRLLLRLTDPLNLSRISRRTATAPFVP
jgi:hypothetical protein